jgi:hypothetical protein
MIWNLSEHQYDYKLFDNKVSRVSMMKSGGWRGNERSSRARRQANCDFLSADARHRHRRRRLA